MRLSCKKYVYYICSCVLLFLMTSCVTTPDLQSSRICAKNNASITVGSEPTTKIAAIEVPYIILPKISAPVKDIEISGFIIPLLFYNSVYINTKKQVYDFSEEMALSAFAGNSFQTFLDHNGRYDITNSTWIGAAFGKVYGEKFTFEPVLNTSFVYLYENMTTYEEVILIRKVNTYGLLSVKPGLILKYNSWYVSGNIEYIKSLYYNKTLYYDNSFTNNKNDQQTKFGISIGYSYY